MDMSSILMRPEGSFMPASRNYGAGAIEASDARIGEEIAARRQARIDSYGVVAEGRVRDDIRVAAKELGEIRPQRQALEEKVKKLKAAEGQLERKRGDLITKHKTMVESKKNMAEKERKREAAFARKNEQMGAKPAGVRKAVPLASPATANFPGFRPAIRRGKLT
ncbi:hypothetical protein BKA63DRAFT_465310 [Paraphoma chrysanthemicola]|nr:hypothetical protein BKA63DRAFT_465310 [Paraphoma chrysanthemicola]